MQHYAAFHLGLHCLQKYSLRGFPEYKGLVDRGILEFGKQLGRSGIWLMCMVIVAQSIPQWQSCQQNLNVGHDPRSGRLAGVIHQPGDDRPC